MKVQPAKVHAVAIARAADSVEDVAIGSCLHINQSRLRDHRFEPVLLAAVAERPSYDDSTFSRLMIENILLN